MPPVEFASNACNTALDTRFYPGSLHPLQHSRSRGLVGTCRLCLEAAKPIGSAVRTMLWILASKSPSVEYMAVTACCSQKDPAGVGYSHFACHTASIYVEFAVSIKQANRCGASCGKAEVTR